MFTIEIAGIIINIQNKHKYVESICRDFITDRQNFDFSVSVSSEEFSKEREATPPSFSDGFIESVCIYRNISKQLPKYNALVLHAAALEYEGRAYCFLAPSGTGKTTHVMLWQECFLDKVSIINGDKPILRIMKDGKIYVCGTPWGGKEELFSNKCVPLKSICFIERANNNSISKIDSHIALTKILPQLFFDITPSHKSETISLLEPILRNSEFWLLKCDKTTDAAITSFNALTSKD